MEEDALYPISDALQLVEAFEHCTLDDFDWTHEAHLVIALSMLARFGDAAFEEMKERLLRFNPTVGRAGTFHATMTDFWLKAVEKTCKNADGQVKFDQKTLDDLLFDEDLADRNFWLRFYTQEEMMSDLARVERLGIKDVRVY